MLTDLLREMGFTVPRRGADQPAVGVSACLLGRPVRYDGDHKRDARVSDRLAALVRLCETCPEVGIGLPVPRPPIRVITVNGEQRVRGVHQSETDFTEALRGYADGIGGPLNGFIFKARSPSCGLGTTPLHDSRGLETGLTDGAFAARLRQRFPGLPLCNDIELGDEDTLTAFVLAVYCHWRGDDAPPGLPAPLRERVQRYLN